MSDDSDCNCEQSLRLKETVQELLDREDDLKRLWKAAQARVAELEERVAELADDLNGMGQACVDMCCDGSRNARGHGAATERARIVGWLRKLNCAGVVPSAVLDNAIDDIERNEHHLEDDA